jgi:hypothetical protein
LNAKPLASNSSLKMITSTLCRLFGITMYRDFPRFASAVIV